MMGKEIHSLKAPVSAIIKISVIVAVVILYLHYFLPQNWGYFAMKPAQTFYQVYSVQNGVIQNKPIIHNNMSFGMGISRKGRVYYKELIKILNNNKHIPWKPLEKGSIPFLSQGADYDTLYIDNSKSFFTGKLLITSSQRPSDTMLLNHKSMPLAKQFILAVTKVK
ncbi:MAG: hypothetical protein H0V14_10650 [Chitinophagaceae bacterium]|nr:hypothetical protein [Chitinophagaceae bacterium]